jgi:hypothetical protein
MNKSSFKRKTLAMAVNAAMLGLGAAGSAQAEVYGIATDQLDTVVLSAGSGTLSLTGTNANRISANGATFGGSGPATSDSATPPAAAIADDSGYNQGTTTIVVGGFGDSQVFGDPLGAGATANATAQARLTTGMNGDASATGRDAFSGNILLTLSAPSIVTLSFFDNANLVAFSDVTGGNAKASDTSRFTITDINGLMGPVGGEVFRFAPNGDVVAGGPSNTTETLDPFSLNQEISSIGTQGLVVGAGSDLGRQRFSASTTTALFAGTYRLDLLIQKNASVTQDVPEPSSILLTALALTGLGITTRRNARR